MEVCEWNIKIVDFFFLKIDFLLLLCLQEKSCSSGLNWWLSNVKFPNPEGEFKMKNAVGKSIESKVLMSSINLY